MKRALAILLVFGFQLAHAAPNQVLVLRSEGTADMASRTSIDTHVLRLARHLDGRVEAGEITLTEAAAAVGCDPSDAACKDEVLATLGVDEIVATTVTASPTGLNVTVRRLSKGNAPRVAQTTVPSGVRPDAKLDTDIGPLFGVATAPPPIVDDRPSPAAPPVAPSPVRPEPPPTTDTTAMGGTTVTAAPAGAIGPPPEGAPKSRRIEKIGMATGGAFVLLGFLMWGGASDKQDQIDRADVDTAADFRHLQQLEEEADALAGAGNFFFLVGAAVGGVSAYFYWKAGKQSTQTARVTPAVFPGGAGVTLTLGGAP